MNVSRCFRLGAYKAGNGAKAGVGMAVDGLCRLCATQDEFFRIAVICMYVCFIFCLGTVQNTLNRVAGSIMGMDRLDFPFHISAYIRFLKGIAGIRVRMAICNCAFIKATG